MRIEVYRRRDPARSLVHRVVLARWREFVDIADTRGRGLPRYVRKAFEGFLACGDLKRGFVRVHCGECGHDAVVAYS